MKRGPQHFQDGDARFPPWQREQQQHFPSPGLACMKLLISVKEASCMLGPGGSACREIGQNTGTKLHLSGRNELYPGTYLQELSVKGPSADAVTACLMQVLGRIAEETGRVCSGENDIEEGCARVHLVVPISSARAIIGKGGENIKAIRAGSGLHVHVEEFALGVGDAAEQVVSLQGSLEGMATALPNLVEKVAAFASEPGFAAWAATSQAGNGSAMAMQVAPGKASGKGKAAPRAPYAGSWSNGWGNGWTRHDEAVAYPVAEGHHRRAHRAPPEWGPPPESTGLELITSAIQTMPPAMLSPSDRSQKVTFNCPAFCVSAVIGKGGAGVKEISAATQTKIMIREIEDNASERAVTISGGALGVAAAFLHVSGRVATVLMSAPPEAPPGTPALPA
mmetsp:Transcript_30243/g.86686  ORF Transcript_30243/g.86686 Transcript_30243/m.86686 type:complete len:394 (+) Transcript_30243:97-1278(+)